MCNVGVSQRLGIRIIAMTVDQLINILAAITLIEMMVTIGLGVTLSDVLRVGRSWGLWQVESCRDKGLVWSRLVGPRTSRDCGKVERGVVLRTTS